MKNLFIIFLLSINLCFAQMPNTSTELEITETNIVEHPYLKSDKISVFGIKLGMSKEDVYKALDKIEDLEYQIDYSHLTSDFRIYVSDKNNETEDNQILYLIWTDNVKELNNIVFYKNFEPYLVGNAKTLLSFDFLDPKSNLVKYYLGKADRKETTLDIPSIKMKYITYFYDSKGLSFTEMNAGDSKTTIFTYYK